MSPFLQSLRWVGDRRTFRVATVYTDAYPQPQPNGPRWADAGKPAGHSSTPIRLRRVSGPLAVVGSDTLRIEFDSLDPADKPIRGTFLACSVGDLQFRYTEQVGMLPRGLKGLVEGREQTLSLDPIPPLRASGAPVELNGASSAVVPVQFCMAHGPAAVEDGKLRVTELPARAKLPVEVKVVAWQFGSALEPRLKTACLSPEPRSSTGLSTRRKTRPGTVDGRRLHRSPALAYGAFSDRTMIRFSSAVLALIALWLSAWPLPAVQDPSGEFLKAYTAFQQAERLESEGRTGPALAKLRFAAGVLDQIARENPDWQPLVVEYRARKVRERLDRLQARATAQPPDPTPPPSSPLPFAPTVSVSPLPQPIHPQPTPPPTPRPTPDPMIEQARQTAARLRELQNEVDVAREVARAARQERDRFAKLLGEHQAKLQEAAATIDRNHTTEAELRSQINQLQEALAVAAARAETEEKLHNELERLQNALLDAEADREVADEENRELAEQLARSRAVTARVTRERDQAMDELAKAREAAREMDRLIAENADLSRQLADATRAIAAFKADQPLKEREISGLKDEIAGLKEQLAIAQAQSLNYQGTVAQLQKQIEEANRTIDQLKTRAAVDEDAARIAQENELLRNILTRELREQARREQARKLAIEELSRMETQSDLLLEQIDLLAGPIYRLTKEELALLKAPDLALPDPEPASVSLALAAKKSAAPDAGGGSDAAAPSVQLESRPNVPRELEPLARDARALFEKGEYRDAERLYEQLLAKAPNNLHALSNLGVTRFRAGKLKAAQLTLEKAVAIAPEDPFCLSTLGIVYYRQGKFDQAIQVLTKALAIDPKNAVAHNHLGITASQKGWQEAAEKELQAAIELNPNYADAHFNLAVIYASSDPPSKELARRHYRRALELGTEADPDLEKLLQ